jgi:endonuclease I
MDPAQSGLQKTNVLTCFPGKMTASRGSRPAAEATEGMDCEAAETTVHWQAGSGRLDSLVQSWKTRGMKHCADASRRGSTDLPHHRSPDK